MTKNVGQARKTLNERTRNILIEIRGGKMKKLQIKSDIDGDKVGFVIYKSKAMSKIEILGILNIISQEITNQLKDEITIVRKEE